MLNPKYTPPRKEEVRKEVENINTTTQRLNYLRRVLARHEQDAEAPPEDMHGFSINDGKITVGKNVDFKYDVGEGVEEADQEIVKEYRRWLRLEIEYWEERLPEKCITQAELERYSKEDTSNREPLNSSTSKRRIPWEGGDTDLAYLFVRLREEGFLPHSFFQKDGWKRVESCFEKSSGKEIQNLNRAKYNIKKNSGSKSQNGDQIDAIVDDVHELPEKLRSED